MGRLADRLASIHVRARVPGTEIHGEMRHPGHIAVTFGPDTYEWLHEQHLAHHLATLARQLHAGWTREYRAALADSLLNVDPADDVRDHAYERARDQLTTTATSPDGRITISAVGLRDFTVHITPGTLHTLNEHQFTQATNEAATTFFTNHMTQIQELKTKHLT